MKRTSWTTQEYAEALRNRGVVNHIEAACGQPIKRHKFNAVKTTVDGIVFDSKAEARHYQTLKVLAAVGDIADLKLQPRFILQDGFVDSQGKRHRAVSYVADFSFTQGGKLRVQDVKGMLTPVFAIKLKMFSFKYPDITLEIVK